MARLLPSVKDLTGDELQKFKDTMKSTSSQIRCCIPAIIESIDYNRMTIEAKPCIREKVKQPDNTYKDIDLPTLLDVPVVFPSSSKYAITFPLSKGDEVLIIFADMCIDSWWQSGGIQNQFESRRHDLSDAFAIPSRMSQVKKIDNFNINNLEIRNNASGIKIEVLDNDIELAGVSILQFKKSFDDLVKAHNQLREEYNQLRAEYDEHKHSVLVDGVTSGIDSVIATTNVPVK